VWVPGFYLQHRGGKSSIFGSHKGVSELEEVGVIVTSLGFEFALSNNWGLNFWSDLNFWPNLYIKASEIVTFELSHSWKLNFIWTFITHKNFANGINHKGASYSWWHVPVNLSTLEAEEGGLCIWGQLGLQQVQGQPGPYYLQTLPWNSNNERKKRKKPKAQRS
jgi:hypothetical protein